MNTLSLSATKARNTFFDLLNQVIMGQSIVIERNDVPVAIITGVKPKTDMVKLKKVLKASKGVVEKNAFLASDNPLRKTGASKFLGRWEIKN